MKVRMKVDISGTRSGQPWPRRGEVIDLPDATGAHLCANGQAEPVTDDDTVEKAVAPEPEKRTRKRSPGLTKASMSDGDTDSARP